MAEMELVQKGVRQGMQQGARQGQALVLRRLISRKFGEETAGRLSGQIDELTGPDGIDMVTDALLECATGAEFIERVRMA